MKVFILNWKLLNNIACLKKQTFFSDFTRPLPIGGWETSIGRRLGCGMDKYAALRGSVVILRCLPQFRVCWTPPQLESQFGYELTETSYLDLEMKRSGTQGSVQKRALNPPHWTTTPWNFLCTAVKCSFYDPYNRRTFPYFRMTWKNCVDVDGHNLPVNLIDWTSVFFAGAVFETMFYSLNQSCIAVKSWSEVHN